MGNIAEVLKNVPEVKLRIIPLTCELVDEDGHIDIKKASFRAGEVDAALQEADSYARQTTSAVQHLKNIPRDK